MNRVANAERPVKVCRVVTRLNIGGPARHVVILSEAFNRDGWETVLVSGPPEAEEGDMGGLMPSSVRWIRLTRLRRLLNPIHDLIAWWQLLRLISRERPVIVHTHTAKAGALGRAAALCYNGWQRVRGRRPRAVLVHTFHGHVLSGYFSPVTTQLFTRIERWLGRRTDALVAVSPSVREDLLNRYIGRPERLHVVPLGLELADFFLVQGADGGFRRELGISANEILIGIVGRLVPIKDHELFLKTVCLLSGRQPAYRFVIVGDGESRQALEHLTDRLDVRHLVQFTGWRLDLPRVYADLDCVCLTSRNEGTPVSLIEALAAARPVVATAVGGVADLCGPCVASANGYDVAERGLLVAREAGADGMAAAIERAVSDRLLARAMGIAGRAFVREQYASERLVHDLRTLYQQLLGIPSEQAVSEEVRVS